MDGALSPALFALAGSFIGGVTTGMGGWLTQRARLRSDRIAHEVARREDLYKEFIILASKTFGEALVSSEPAIHDLVNLHATVSRLRVVSSQRVVACAEKIVGMIVATYETPKRSFGELNALARSDDLVDPFREFSDVARDDLVNSGWS